MGVIILFLVVLGVIAAWWLSQQRLMAKPWLEAGPIGDVPGTGASPLPAAKIGLGVFLAVAGVLFALFLSAYSMRMQMGDWRPLPAPALLWLNTLVLVLSSVALHSAQAAARRGQMEGVRAGLLAAGTFSACLPGRADPGLAPTDRRRLCPDVQPGQRLLLRTHWGARAACAWWPGGVR